MKAPVKNEQDFGLAWKILPINLLGIVITNDEKTSMEQNFDIRVNSIEILTKIWSTRNLSLKGKLSIINALLIPKIIYPCTILVTPKETIGKVDKILNNFLWNWKKPKIKKDVLIRKTKSGGLKVPCLECKIDAWKSKWAIRCLKNEPFEPLWVHLVNMMLPNELKLPYLLKTRPTKSCLTVHCPKLSIFYIQIIQTWSSIRDTVKLTTIEQIRNEYLWLNKHIMSNNKTLYCKRSLSNKLLSIQNILTDANTFKDLKDINLQYQVNWNFLDYLRIRQSIPHEWKQILNLTQKEDKSNDILYNKLLRYKTLKSVDCYWLLLPSKHDLNTIPNSIQYWKTKYALTDASLDNLITTPYTSLRDTYTQTLQYKILHKIFNCNHWLHKLKILNNPNCKFCNEDDTIEHYFYTCTKTYDFWTFIKNWWNRLNLFKIDTLTEKDIILGIENDSQTGEILNCIILIAKASIYNNKSNNKEPDIYTFFCQLKFFLTMEEAIATKNKVYNTYINKWEAIAEFL
jgi:hypothetical protein